MNSEETLYRTVVTEDGAAILDIRAGHITTLNSTGAFVWQELEKGRQASEIVALLAQETGESPSLVEQDVIGFIAELDRNRLRSR